MIGLTTDEMLETKTLKHLIPPYNARKKNLINYLKKMGYLQRTEIITLSDPFGPAIEDAGLEAITVSEDTVHMEEKINTVRKEKGLFPLEFIVVKMVLADDQKPISSTRIRKKELDMEGRLITQKNHKN